MSVPEAPEAFLFQRLTSQTSVYSLVGNKIFPLLAPQGTGLPLVVYQRTAVERPRHLGGNVGNPVVTLQLTAYDSSYTSVKSIARAVRLAVDNWTGTTAGVTIQRSTLVSEADGVDLPADDQMLPYYNVQQTYEFRINEALTPPATVPGAPAITSAVYNSNNQNTQLTWTAPASNGGSAITVYSLYINGVYFVSLSGTSSNISEAPVGSVIRLSAVNAVGEGPQSAPFTVT